MKLLTTTLLSFAVALLASTASYAAPANVKTPLGVDISYPQCNAKVPTDHAFGIVGVNNGLATQPNPCLGQQLTW